MKASLVLEAIAYDMASRMRGLDDMGDKLGLPTREAFGHPYHWQRWGVWLVTRSGEYEQYPRMDYSQANSRGSRGVRACYVLESGKRYRVCSPVSWKRTDRYHCRVTEEGDIVREG